MQINAPCNNIRQNNISEGLPVKAAQQTANTTVTTQESTLSNVEIFLLIY